MQQGSQSVLTICIVADAGPAGANLVLSRVAHRATRATVINVDRGIGARVVATGGSSGAGPDGL